MLILNNGYMQQMFSCYEELLDFIGESDFNAVIQGEHSQYSLSYLHIT